MKMLFKLLVLGVSLIACPRILYAKPALTKEIVQQTLSKLDIEIPIRVLLDEKDPRKVGWQLGARGGFVVYTPETKHKTVYQAQVMQITSNGAQFFINGNPQTSKHLFIIPLQSPVLFQKHIYDGVLAVTLYKESAYLVNHVDLEDYVLSVLPYESWPQWPDEVHKAFCVAFRSYGITKVLEQRAYHTKKGQALPYDIKSTNAHQIYKGRSHTTRFKRIIDETRGIVLAYKNQPILAMFDICCGGVIPAKKKGIHFNKAPYLKRPYACNHCKDSRYYRWSCTYTFEELEEGLKKEIPHGGPFNDIKIVSLDDAGVVQEVRVRLGSQWHTLTASKFKSCFKNMRSLWFRVQKNTRSLKITGRGNGHHMGLCQRGAYYMVCKKWKYRDILRFYYPHTDFMKLKKMSYP